MATTDKVGSSNMQQSVPNVKISRLWRRRSWDRSTNLGAMKLLPMTAQERAYAEIRALTGLKSDKAARAFYRLTLSALAEGPATEFTVAMLAVHGGCCNTSADEWKSLMVTGGFVRQTCDAPRDADGKFTGPAKFILDKPFLSQTRFHRMDHHLEVLPVQALQPVQAVVPAVQALQPEKKKGPTHPKAKQPTCQGVGGRTVSSSGKTINLTEMVQMIKAVDGTVEVQPEMMAGALRKRGTTTAEVTSAIADATLVARQRKCDPRQLVISCLVGPKVEATRSAIAATAATLRAAGATSPAPVQAHSAGDTEAALRALASHFQFSPTVTERLLKMALTAVKADPQAAQIAVEAVGPYLKESLTPNLRELRAFAWMMLTQKDIWIAANENPDVIAAVAAYHTAKKRACSKGAPDEVALLLIRHKSLLADFDAARKVMAEIVDLAESLLPVPVGPAVAERLIASGIAVGSLTFMTTHRYHRAREVIEATPWLAAYVASAA